ncbi:hypothetical protein HBB16_19460, partial [Pseudonocardia sp. MCCB 268]|nr:hypothetical protein [Pseudonocardia cytotoxica]
MNDHEDGTGQQFENNWHYADALSPPADRAISSGTLCNTFAHDAGMCRDVRLPFSNVTGNGSHLHQSVDPAGEPVFAGDDDPLMGCPERPSHLPRRPARARPVDGRADLPDGQSLQRIGVGAPDVRRPGRRPTPPYGGNNRTVMLRIPEGGRIEHRRRRLANPYLASAALLAAGLTVSTASSTRPRCCRFRFVVVCLTLAMIAPTAIL